MMNATSMSHGLSMRPSRPGDAGFLATLHRSTRNDLWLVDGERDFVETLIADQRRYQEVGYGDAYPEAMYFVIEKLGERIGRVVVDFAENEVHVLDLALIPGARGRGYGTAVVRGMQVAAAQVLAPLTLSVMRTNRKGFEHYLRMGFGVARVVPTFVTMTWVPHALRHLSTKGEIAHV